MKNLKARRQGFIYMIVAVLLVMTFVIISSDQVFAGGDDFATATWFKLNKTKKGITWREGAEDYYKFKTSSAKASYKFILRSLDGNTVDVSLYDKHTDWVGNVRTNKAKTRVFKNLKRNTVYYLHISTNWYYYDHAKYAFQIKEIKRAIKRPAKVALKKVKAGKKKVTISWKSAARAKKYQVGIRKGKGKWKTYTTSAKKKTIKKLKSKKKYSVRVRGFFKYKGKKRYGKWSKVKTVKVK